MVLGANWAMADSRTDSLGLTAGQQIDDLDSIWLFPQNAADFGNVVDNRFGTSANSGVLTPDNDWFGIIDQEWPDLGYIGAYTKRPFNDSNGIVPAFAPENQFGIFNYIGGSWNNALDPLAAGGAQITTHVGAAAFTAVPLILPIADPENKLDAFWAQKYSDVNLGIHVNYASQSVSEYAAVGYVNPPAGGTLLNENEVGGDQVLGLDLGLGVKNFILWDSFNVAVGYSMGSVNYGIQDNAENSTQNGTQNEINFQEKDHGISEFRINALGVSKISDTTNGRLYLNIRLDSLGVDSTLTETADNGTLETAAGDQFAQTNTYTDTNINIGYALNHKVGDGKAMVIASLTGIFDDRKWTATDLENAGGSSTANQVEDTSGETVEETALVIPLNVAFEAPLFDWMKFRMGVYKNIFQTLTDKIVMPTDVNGAGTGYQSDDTGAETVDAVAGISTFMGVGMNFSNFTLDFQLNPTNLLTALNGAAPGDGILYGQSTSGQNASIINDLWTSIAQLDMRYAF